MVKLPVYQSSAVVVNSFKSRYHHRRVRIVHLISGDPVKGSGQAWQTGNGALTLAFPSCLTKQRALVRARPLRSWRWTAEIAMDSYLRASLIHKPLSLSPRISMEQIPSAPVLLLFTRWHYASPDSLMDKKRAFWAMSVSVGEDLGVWRAVTTPIGRFGASR
jgi:hypothetical protein